MEQAAATADFVIEAATERLPIKAKIVTTLCRSAPDPAILTTNSSTLGSSKVADITGRPEKVWNLNRHSVRRPPPQSSANA